MAQIKKFLQDLSGQQEAQKEGEREVQLLVEMANNKLDALEAKVRETYRNKEVFGKIEIVGDRMGEFSRGYRVNYQDGEIGEGVKGIIAEIMNIGEESAQKLIAKTITNALSAIFATTSAGAEEKQLFKVVFEKVAVVRYDFYVWRYAVRSDGMFKRSKSVVAYTYSRGVVDHTKVSLDELLDAISQSMPSATLDEIKDYEKKLRQIWDSQRRMSPNDAVKRFADAAR